MTTLVAQRQSALDRANAARTGIAQVKRELTAGVLLFEDALQDERAHAQPVHSRRDFG